MASNRDVNVVFTNSAGLNTKLTFHLTVENVPDMTDISAVSRTFPRSQNAIYDMNGRQLAAVKKGLNIINGKKVVVK